ncbi:AUXIN RESPONSE FACTOR 4-RELATED [Salix koriyanagi]|uniref:Auxin response factor n=1 Tax=Salix koriyanagi TaxID=2511006 RepID=A0A9Q0TD46_9ROSI|nr:AUXIN RESPONSE FACTOR 4-RELATED [Salix koriyanagi]
MPPPPQLTELSRVDPRIWRACAGSSVQVPAVNSRVYYFPQGHFEQSSSSTVPHPPFISNFALSKPSIPCQISAVDFLADPITDEVFTRILLIPLDNPSSNLPLSFVESCRSEGVNDVDDDESKILAFSKILTPSDANNGGGFSVPRFCADSIFPPLNYQAEPPVQTLTVADIHGVNWDFRHIYRGTPRRHLLTTGWSKFVNNKKLIAGDSVVFMRNLKGEMFIGVRRSVRFNNSARWREQISDSGGEGKVKVEEGFSRSWRGRLSQEAVVEAVERAAKGLPFEVVYYPRAGWYSDFVVRAEVVEAALCVFWTAGMRVKMTMETEDSSRMTWFQGTVSSTGLPDCGAWRGSPWRMLQITWDEPDALQNAKRVSPWQVEFVATTLPLQDASPPMKKLRYPHDSGFLTNGELFFPMSGLTNSRTRHINASMLSYSTFPAGMQGARQDPFSTFSLSNFISENASQVLGDKVSGNNLVPKMKRMPSEMNISSLRSGDLSPDNQSSAHSFGEDFTGNRNSNPQKVGISSIQLFGKIIHMNQPVENGFDTVGFMDNSSKGCNETEGVNALELSLTSSYTELLNRIDVQCQSASAVGACSA